MERTVHIAAFGCQMNMQESAIMADLLASAGYVVQEELSGADVVVLETCAIRKKAEDKAYSLLGTLRRMRKHKGTPKKIAVCGCIVTPEGVNELVKDYGVSVVLGPRRVAGIADALLRSEAGPVVDIGSEWFIPPADVAAPHIPGVSAYVTVMQGCSNACSYCVVPSRRGKAESRPMDDIAAELRMLAEKGYKEVTLLGQNISYYGMDKRGHPRLADLLERLDADASLPRIRYATSHPAFIDDDSIARVSRLERVMPHIHLPVQSGSDRMLKEMRRGYSAARFLEIVGAFRCASERFGVSTDIIAGYDGESIDDHHASLALVEQAKLDGAYVFPYSERPGTAAAERKSGESLPPEERRRRCHEILKAVANTAAMRRKADRGSIVEVLVERPGEGRSAANIPVSFDGGVAGAFVKVEVDSTTPFALIGRIVEGAP